MSEYSRLYEAEASSIRGFLEAHADKLGGTVLDYGCGRQPYRDIVIKAGGTYFAYDRPGFGGSQVEEHIGVPVAAVDAVICTQVIQYVTNPPEFVESLHFMLAPGGWLLMTGPTNWPVLEPADLWRLTPAGIAHLLGARFPLVEVAERHTIRSNGRPWLCGWAAVAQA